MLLRVLLIMMLPLISYGQTAADGNKENVLLPSATEDVAPPETEGVSSSEKMMNTQAETSGKSVQSNTVKETLNPLQVKERIRVNANVNFPQDI